MPKVSAGTAAAAAHILALALIATPATAFQRPPEFKKSAPASQSGSWLLDPRTPRAAASSFADPDSTVLSDQWNADRETTARELLIGELRALALLDENWDGEGANAPIPESISSAVNFTRLLDEAALLPEQMIHSSGRTGLLWRVGRVYADLEFYADGRIAFYIERNGDRYKGAVKFDNESMPTVFPPLLRS